MLARLDLIDTCDEGDSAVADADIVPESVAGKVALVAGGGSGIGEAISRRLAAEGGSVAVLDLRTDGVSSEASGTAGRHGQPPARRRHRRGSSAGCCRAVVAERGRLDLAVSNAGVGGDNASCRRLHPETWRRLIETTSAAPSTACVPRSSHGRERRWGDREGRSTAPGQGGPRGTGDRERGCHLDELGGFP